MVLQFSLHLFLITLVSCSDISDDSDWVVTANPHVLDFASNPILRPTEILEWLIGDPTIVQLGDEIHMFANSVFHGILHYTAAISSPTQFTKQSTIIPIPGAVRPYAYLEDDQLYLFYEQYQVPLPPNYQSSAIMLRTANVSFSDSGLIIMTWSSSSSTQLTPQLHWEKVGSHRVGNPFVFYSHLHQQYHMYYSASSIHLQDSNIDEPLFLGLASSSSPSGPWKRVSEEEPVVIAKTGIPGKEILGIGSLKLVKSPSTANSTAMFALCNRITRDTATNATGSTISLLSSSSDSGMSWDISIGELIAPTSQEPGSWKHAYVYGYDSMGDPQDDSYFLVYYNGRNKWRQAEETIGVSRVDVRVISRNVIN